MSARESIENLWDRATPVGPLLDQYAHELAEKIRNAPFEEHLLQKHQRARAADLIDPKKEG